MRQFQALALGLSILLGSGFPQDAALADEPVVIELYTSQGCSSCPPADALLRELSVRDDVIPLALHVDYWDYIGWEDTFGQAQFTRRQKGYARAAGKRMVYTPQMVIEGQDHLVGSKPQEVERLIRRHKANDSGIDLSVSREGDQLTIRASADRPRDKPLWVQLVRVRDSQPVEIRRGENAGKRIIYSNIVSEWMHLEPWDSRTPLTMRRSIKGDEGVVVIVQKPGFGPILAAARVR